MLDRIRRWIAFPAIALLALTIAPAGAASGTAQLALSLAVEPNPASYLEPIRVVGGLQPVSGTPSNFTVWMEGGFSGGECPDADCVFSSGHPTWHFDKLTKAARVVFDTNAEPDQTIYFYWTGGNVSCTNTCSGVVNIGHATVITSLHVGSDGQVLTGSTLHVTVSASADAPSVGGDLHVNLPDGVDAPTSLPDGATYSGPPAHYVDFPLTANPTASYSFDVQVNADAGSVLAFSGSFSSSDGTAHAQDSQVSLTVGPDTVRPTSTAPRQALAAGRTMHGNRLPVRLHWSGKDADSGIDHYVLAQRKDGGRWTVVANNLWASSAVRYLAPGHSYRFRVRAVDRAGNVGAWVAGPTFRVRRMTESSAAVHYRRTWALHRSSAYWGGKVRASGTKGARAKFTFTGRSISWVTTRGVNRGDAIVYVNGKRVATVHLFALSTQTRFVAWQHTWSRVATRTVVIKVVGTAGRSRVDIDGFGVIR